MEYYNYFNKIVKKSNKEGRSIINRFHVKFLKIDYTRNMKKFITDYLNIIIYCILGLVLMIASFYLFINYYHSEEVKTTIYVSDTDTKYLNYKQNIKY